MVTINFSYFVRQLLVEGFKLRIQRCKLGKMGDRLIQQVITEHGRLIAIVRRQPPPDGGQVFLLLWTLVQPRISSAVIDVRARLSARCGMQIKDHIYAFGAAPVDQTVQQLETFRFVALKKAVMQRNSNGVEPDSMQERNVVMRNVVLAVLLPECS